MNDLERQAAELHVYESLPLGARFAGRKRIQGVISIVSLEMALAETRNKAELIRRIRPKIKQAYGSIWMILLLRIAMILVEWWLKRENASG